MTPENTRTHTPAPWTWEAHSDIGYAVMGADGYDLFYSSTGYHDPQHPHHTIGNGTQAEANTRLTAAAPDMYEALGLFVAEVGKYGVTSDGEQVAYDSALAALAKAEGR